MLNNANGTAFPEAKGHWYFIIMASLTFTAADKRKLGFGQQILSDALLSDFESDWFVNWHSDSRNSILWNAERFLTFLVFFVFVFFTKVCHNMFRRALAFFRKNII